MKTILDKSLKVVKETKEIEFKQSFDINSNREWLEFIKHIVAMANSGGGVILIGVDNNGYPCGSDINPILFIDPAKVTDKIRAYTNIHFSEFEIVAVQKEMIRIAAIIVSSVDIPMIFVRPGTYPISGTNKQDRVFSEGTIYFRHGAKSEPGTTEDIRKIIERRLIEIRKEWMDGVRKVVEAPMGSQITVLPPEVRQSEAAGATPIRIVDDPNAPAYRILDQNKTHPFRQNEVLAILRMHLSPSEKLSTFDLLYVRKAFEIDKQEKYFFRPIRGSPQYSQEFINWLTDS